ncbi:ATPase, AAA family domain containing protein [Theileria equi strain WA]|uniref:ATPase, AAA family domain containing protein n=1 Tax=Theileria equi strain WA TaxID=1537102 RepID=L1LG03_THEEQ|nr:ATPase, AAA family domain containing protein [Theileria equi strain WA]EKX74266.1 ATPase, AAA family domain containing protein [Theileria equi strain WA]|eukprot:XP_004833718.1 ATPase, AAA family domain containing protein [Theileria equi strain WA]
MPENVLTYRLKSLLERKNLRWPPESVSKFDIKCVRTDSKGTFASIGITDLASELQSFFDDYRRQKILVLKNNIISILNELRSTTSSKKRRPSFYEEEQTDSFISVDDSPEINMENHVRSNTLNSRIRQVYKSNVNVDNSKIDSPKRKIQLDNRDSSYEGTISDTFTYTPELNIATRLSDVGGIENIKAEIEDLVIRPLKYSFLYEHLGVQPTKGILLYGPPGSGKSKLAEAIAGEVGCPFFRIASTEIVTGTSGESESRIRLLFDHAKRVAPSIIFLDELDAITPNRENATKGMDLRIVSQLGISMDSLTGHFVVVIGATNRQEFVDPMIRRNGRFDREIPMGIPNLESRISILKALSSTACLADDINFEDIAHMTPGYVGADLQAVIREAAMISISQLFATKQEIGPDFDKDSLRITQDDFLSAIAKVQPSAKREGFTTIPDITWDNIGALAGLRKELEQHIVFPIKFRNLYKTFGVGDSAGILLYGPPGCGKTLLAKAISNECNANFISVKGPELLNMYVGESERAIRLIFQRAAISAPCVIFFDEVDSICSKRNNDSAKVYELVVNQLLTEMDGIKNREYVYIVAATNRPDMIDSAMLRPGRFEKLMYVPLPNYEGRIDILKKITSKVPMEKDIDLSILAQKTEGYSGADLAYLAREAGISAIEEIKSKVTGENWDSTKMFHKIALPENAKLNMKHFSVALTKTIPSVKQHQLDFYENFRKKHHQCK